MAGFSLTSLKSWRHWSLVRSVVLGFAIMVLIIIAPGIYGSLTASDRLDPALENAQGTIQVDIELGFRPQPFHQAELRTMGVFAGTHDGKTRLVNVTPDNLDDLKRTYWIDRISPASG